MGVQQLSEGPSFSLVRRNGAYRHILIGLAALLPFVVVLLTRAPDGYLPVSGDYAQYLSHARAVAEDRPYTDIGYIYSKFAARTGPASFPPGVPLLLAAAFRLFGASVQVAELVLLPFAVVFLLVAGMYFARTTSLHMGIAVAMIAGLSSSFVHGATMVNSDIALCAFLWGVFALTDIKEGKWTWSRVALISILGALAILVKSAAIALVPAMMLYAVLHYRRLGLRPLAATPVWLGVYFAINALLPVASTYADIFPHTLGGIVSAIASNALTYRFVIMDGLFYPFTGETANLVYHLTAFTLVVAGAFDWLRTRWRTFLTCFCVTYCGLLAVFPGTNARYAWPLYPLLAWCLVRGVVIVAQRSPWRLPARREWWVTTATASLLAISAIASELRRAPRQDFATQPAVRTLFTHLEQSLPQENARVVFANARVLTWETRLSAMQLFAAPRDSVMAELRRKGITHVVLGVNGFQIPTEDTMRALVGEHPSTFTRDFATEAFEVYRFRPTPSGE